LRDAALCWRFWGGIGVKLLEGEVVDPLRDYFLPGFFLPATVRFGPLRVRAFVLVR